MSSSTYASRFRLRACWLCARTVSVPIDGKEIVPHHATEKHIDAPMREAGGRPWPPNVRAAPEPQSTAPTDEPSAPEKPRLRACVTGKIAWLTQEMARKAARFTEQGNAAHGRPKACRIYQCEHCGDWHVTSRPL